MISYGHSARGVVGGISLPAAIQALRTSTVICTRRSAWLKSARSAALGVPGRTISAVQLARRAFARSVAVMVEV